MAPQFARRVAPLAGACRIVPQSWWHAGDSRGPPPVRALRRLLASKAGAAADPAAKQRAEAAKQVPNLVQGSDLERMIAWVHAQDASVVVFDLDGVMSSARRDDHGVPLQEVEGYLARGVSEDFIQAARALSNRGFGLAAVALAAPPPAPPVPPAPPARGWRGAPGNAPRDPGADLAAGPELARKLIARWCPQAQPAFEVVLGYDLGEAPAGPGVLGQQMQRIAEHYRVPCGKLILISARGRTAKSEDGWLRLAVTDPAEGFRFSDCFATKP
ncbi:unnamed protein product [Prorocentrum cordatum]|uniref:Uncharacterized protein n=1 Tax=Prorocentrum cordatum TaxID=2364126 RepID=A0ABN9RUK8_9DINO|nr:unnamed protein product [Polarella glacialis]